MVMWEEKVLKDLLNALFIPDVRVNFTENRQFGAVQGRNVKASLSHQCEKSHGFQGNGFTAGVGSGYHQADRNPRPDECQWELPVSSESEGGVPVSGGFFFLY